jgi:hypothetical protein
MMNIQAKSSNNPATSAASLLLRIALILLCIIIPSFAFVSRRVVLVLVPIALTMIVIANTVVLEDFSVVQRLKNILSRIAGLSAFTLVTWSVFSLFWTPYPDEASERLLKALGTVLLGFAACLSLPQNMRAPNIHIVTLGVIAAALMSIAVTASLHIGYRPVSPHGVTIARAAIMLALFIWPAIAWLKTRATFWQAVALSVIVFLAILLSGSQLALLTFLGSFAIFGIATIWPKGTAYGLALAIILSIMSAPLLAFIAQNLSSHFEVYPIIYSNLAFQTLKNWGYLITTDPLHFLTGYGFEAAVNERKTMVSNIPFLNIIINLWYDLGLIGACGVAALLANLIMRCLHLPRAITAPLTAAISATCILAAISNTATQVWFLSSLAIVAIAFMAVKNGQHRTVRPKPIHH